MKSAKPMRWDTREPCSTCPYRRDAPRGLWDPSEFQNLIHNDKNELGGAIFGCHGTRKDRNGPAVCGGWLFDQARRGVPSIQLRLSAAFEPAAAKAIDEVHDGGNAVFNSIEEMCRANGVDANGRIVRRLKAPIKRNKGSKR